jgi:hypothetical protein
MYAQKLTYLKGTDNRSAGTHHPTPLRLLGEGQQCKNFPDYHRKATQHATQSRFY